MRKLLITGANGQLGRELQTILAAGRAPIGPIDPSWEACEVVPTDVDELDITDADAVMAFVRDGGFDAVVNCAAATNVDGCETNRDLAQRLNADAAANLARAAEAAGADAISLINTLMGMAIDAERRRTVTARPLCGFSGPAIKPVALRCVWQCHNAVKVPLLGMGGIACGTDAVEFMLAGATAVAVGTANFVNPQATIDVIDGIAEYCERHGVKDVNELIGALQC